VNQVVRPDTARRKSTTRFAIELILVLIVVCVAVYLVLLRDLERTLKYRLDRLHAMGVPQSWAEVIPPPVPDEENAAVAYQQAFRLLLRLRDQAGASSELGRAGGADQITDDERAVLDLLKEGAQRPHCRFPMSQAAISPDTDYDFLRGLSASCRLLADEASSALDGGRIDEAVTLCRTGLRLSDQTARFSTETYFFTGTYQRMRILEALRQVLEQSELEGDTCRSLYEQLHEFEFDVTLRRAARNEVCRVLWCYEAIDRRANEPRIILADERIGDRILHMRASKRFYLSPLARLLRLKEEIAHAELMEQELPLSSMAYRDLRHHWPAISRKYDGLPKSYMMAHAFGPLTHPRTATRRDSAVATTNAMEIALALKAYHARHHAYPDSLAALRAYPGWELPEDPFSGKGFGYRRKEAGFVLYSWGEDLDDDGGRVLNYHVSPPDGDLVWEFKR
jgi:hypothetical protein